LAEWGQSIYFEADGKKILFDAGLGPSLVRNARVIGVDLSQIDALVLSHGHADHTGGLKDALEVQAQRPLPIIAHPGVWDKKYIHLGGERFIGIPYARDYLEALGGEFRLTKEPLWVSENVVTSGEVPLKTDFERVDDNILIKENGGFTQDPLMDDVSIYIKTPEGLVVLLGCGHRGIINILSHGLHLTGLDRVRAVIGGTHLFMADEARVKKTIEALRGMALKEIGVSHCTGLEASLKLATAFEGRFFFNNAGTSREYF
jgi:7,8-dihydropterin-6-yl-methyl-4-(beta-D-ribofuranosyl)aminobenzene 5'-phosphate synthase